MLNGAWGVAAPVESKEQLATTEPRIKVEGRVRAYRV